MELTTWNLPVLALRGLTVFPHMTLTFDVERPISIAALERAMEADQDIFLVTQREIGVNAPEEKDLYTIGTVSHITQILRLGQSSVRVMVEGRQRAHLRRLWQTEPFLQANVEAIPEEPSSEAMRKSPRTEALLRQTYALFGEYAEQASGGGHGDGQPGPRLPGGLYCPEHRPALHRQAGDPGGILPLRPAAEAQRFPGAGEQRAGL